MFFNSNTEKARRTGASPLPTGGGQNCRKAVTQSYRGSPRRLSQLPDERLNFSSFHSAFFVQKSKKRGIIPIMKERVFVIEDERRDWAKRIRKCVEQGEGVPPVTRRYLVMAKNPQVRELILREYPTFPYKADGTGEIFYCIAGPSIRRSKEFIRSLLYKIEKFLTPTLAQEIEILEGLTASRTLLETSVRN